jgi:hypothetical protein
MKNALTPDEKNMFDALKSVADFWWQRFDNRIVNIWKLSISLWTAQVGFIGLAASYKIFSENNHSCIAKSIIMIVSVLILVAHYFFLYKAAKAHKIDRGKFKSIEKKYLNIIEHKFPDDISQLSDLAHENTDSFKQWAHFFIIIITFILLVIINLLAFRN